MKLSNSTLRVLLSLVLLAVLIAPHSSAYGQSTTKSAEQQTEAVTRWLQRSALPLKSVEAGNGFEDLQPLKETLKDVRIVALGEATHGTREFFQFKHRLVEFLVRELGFTIFAIEVQYMKCLPVNEYVLGGGEDDPAKVVKTNLSGIYQTEEVVAMVKWMRDYNQTAPPERRVSFRGFDVQTPHLAADAVSAYLKRVAPDYLAVVQKTINETSPKGYRLFWDAYAKRPMAQKAAMHSRLLQLAGYLATHQARFVRLTSQAEFDVALQAARILAQSDEVRSTPDAQKQANGDKRDRYMAETVEYLLQRELPGAKAILWAHNFHLWAFQPNADWARDKTVRAELRRSQLLFKTMGAYLREAFGEQYYAFGFMFDQGSFQAIAAEDGNESMEPKEFTLSSSPKGSGGWQMSQAGLGNFAIDLRAEPGRSAVTEWLNAAQSFRYAGADFSTGWMEKEYTLPIVLCGNFDGVVFIQKTARARALR
ncbi:MAG: erythromycin esterase family protein [Blastocatellia bacterium]